MVDVVAQPTRVGTSYVEWGAVLAGAVVASALSFVLLTAGAAVGLSLLSPYPSQSYGKVAGSIAAFWTLFVPILSFLVGGYIAGRMRSAWDGSNLDEVEFRDGIHGLLVWSLGVVLGGVLAFLTAAAAGQAGAQIGRAALTDRGALIAPAIDSMLRAAATSSATTASDAATRPAATPAQPRASGPAARGEISRVVAGALADGRLNASDKQYLAQLVAERTGMSQADAAKRVDDAYAQAVRAVDKARKTTVLAGLATATALLIGLAAAWYAAQRGGRHRDQNIPAKFGFSRPGVPRRPAS